MSFEFIATRVNNEKSYLDKEDLLFKRLLIVYGLYVLSKIRYLIKKKQINDIHSLTRNLRLFDYSTSCSSYNMNSFEKCKEKIDTYITKYHDFFDKYFDRTKMIPYIFEFKLAKMDDFINIDKIRLYLENFYDFLELDSRKISKINFTSYLIDKLDDKNIDSFQKKIHEYFIIYNEQFTQIFSESECTIDYVELMNNSFRPSCQVISFFMFRGKENNDTMLNYTSHMFIVRNLFHDIFLDISKIKLKQTSIALHSYASFIADEQFFLVSPRGNMEVILTDYKLQDNTKLLIVNDLDYEEENKKKFFDKVSDLHKKLNKHKPDEDINKYLSKYSENIKPCSYDGKQVINIDRFINYAYIVFTDNFHDEWKFLLEQYNKIKLQNGGYKYKKSKYRKQKNNQKFTNKKNSGKLSIRRI